MNPLPPFRFRFHFIIRKVNRVAVMGGKHVVANHFWLPFFHVEGIINGERIAQALTHLDPFQGQGAGEHPIIAKRRPMSALALGDFTLIVREDVVDSPSMNVKGFAKVFTGHG